MAQFRRDAHARKEMYQRRRRLRTAARCALAGVALLWLGFVSWLVHAMVVLGVAGMARGVL